MAPAPAAAGAWIAPKGGQTISTEIAGQRDEVLYSESTLYIEEPLRVDTSAIASWWLTNDPNQQGLDALRWEVNLAAKHVVLRQERRIVALQGGLIWYSDPERGCSEAGAELRMLGGINVGAHGFANIEVAERAGPNGCGGERVDLSFGHRQGRWLGLSQIFFDQPRQGESLIKLQLTAVRFGDRGRGLQIGVRARLDGGGDAEPALVLGTWDRNSRREGGR